MASFRNIKVRLGRGNSVVRDNKEDDELLILSALFLEETSASARKAQWPPTPQHSLNPLDNIGFQGLAAFQISCVLPRDSNRDKGSEGQVAAVLSAYSSIGDCWFYY